VAEVIALIQIQLDLRIDKLREGIMFRRKITLKLSLIVTCSLVLLVGIVIAAQFFIVSRMYLTTEYTKQRETILLDESNLVVDRYNAVIGLDDENKRITEILNRYTREHAAYCFILDKNYNIIYKADNVSELNQIYIDNVQKMFLDGEVFSDLHCSFRINGFLNIPSKYVGIYKDLLYDSLGNKSKENRLYFVAITNEVYTNENYLVLRKYSAYLLIMVTIFAVVLGAGFSYIVTLPILKIRDTAARMTKLDFTQKCDYKANDEIGDLSKSLNFLSEKLNDTIRQLNESNEKLKGDLDVQREIDQLRKDFIASVSHEFKTPLTLIRGFNEIIMDNRVKDEELHEAQNIIMDEIDRMDKLVQELLDLSKLESATYELHELKFDCMELLSIIVDKCGIMMKERSINFYFEFDDKVVWVYADKSRIEQVIMNFITNAIFNTLENGNIILKSEIRNEFITISVFNEGIHIKENEINKIWEKFYRSDKSRSKKTGGTGLGLAICKEILEKHESSYGVENTENGVRFYFTLKIEK
jgi:two-component system, OmpR family, sensor histidine kinase VanS